MHTTSRETEEEVRTAVDRLIRELDDDTIASAQGALGRLDSPVQQRMTALHAAGSTHRVADRLMEYVALGTDTFVLSWHPHLEEAYRFAELVVPLLPLQVREKVGAQLLAPLGESGAPTRSPA